MQLFRPLFIAFIFSVFAYGTDVVDSDPSCRVEVEGFAIQLPRFVVAELADQTLYIPVGETEGPVPEWVEKYLSGGKHLRPMMAFLTAGALGTELSKIRDLTRLLELTHLGSLALDDVFDGATKRRDKPAVHVAEGFVGGVVTGPWLQAYVSREAAKLTNVSVQIKIGDTLMAMGNGEIKQAQLIKAAQTGGTYNDEDYFKIANGKTGVLFGLSFAIVPLHLQMDGAFAEKWYQLGHGIGVAYQIKDDFEDAEKESKEINYALLKASQHFGGSPFRTISKLDLGAVRRGEIGNMDHRRRRLLGLLGELEESTPRPHSRTQLAAFETIRDIIAYVTVI